jgi:multicomponent K+:H+ antiporter subunit D
MNHWIVAPIILPAVAGALLALVSGRIALERTIGVASTAALLAVAVVLAGIASDGGYTVYALGDWRPPFGIVLVLDRFSALMLLLTAVLALGCLVAAVGATDRRGPLFHALFQFQLMGVNGAFLTGDLFNLFVFFEVLLIASYGLLLHGRTDGRLKAALHYVALNLLGSGLFLVGVAVLYAVTGTLNMADLAMRLPQLGADDAVLARAGGLILLVVFGLKAALFPLALWLPGTYAAASAPVAALFSIMTKVGVYAILRLLITIFGLEAGTLAPLLATALGLAALATMAVAALGLLAAAHLARMAAFLTLLSVGTILAVVVVREPGTLGAALFYLVHSTLASALLFLVVGEVARQRGDDRLRRSGALAQPVAVGSMFLLAAAMIVGVPPFSGFLAKAMLLQASVGSGLRALVWTAILASSLLALLALTRAGVTVFWACRREVAGGATAGVPGLLGSAGLIACLLALMVLAQPVRDYTDGVAAQLRDAQGYASAVLATGGR